MYEEAAFSTSETFKNTGADRVVFRMPRKGGSTSPSAEERVLLQKKKEDFSLSSQNEKPN